MRYYPGILHVRNVRDYSIIDLRKTDGDQLKRSGTTKNAKMRANFTGELKNRFRPVTASGNGCSEWKTIKDWLSVGFPLGRYIFIPFYLGHRLVYSGAEVLRDVCSLDVRLILRVQKADIIPFR